MKTTQWPKCHTRALAPGQPFFSFKFLAPLEHSSGELVGWRVVRPSVCLSVHKHFFLSFFVHTVEAHMGANTQNIQQGEQETRWVGEGRKKKRVWNRDMRRYVEGGGMGWGTQDGHYRDFQVLTRLGLSGRKAGNLKEVGLGWISGGRKDCGFGWGKKRNGGERLF